MRWQTGVPLLTVLSGALPACYSPDFVTPPGEKELGSALVSTMDQVRAWGDCDESGLYWLEHQEQGAFVAPGLAAGVAGVGRGMIAGAIELARAPLAEDASEEVPLAEDYLEYAVGAARFLIAHAATPEAQPGALSWSQCLETTDATGGVPAEEAADEVPGCGADEPVAGLEPAACPALLQTPASGLARGVAGVGDFLLELHGLYELPDLADPTNPEREALLSAAEGAGRWLLANARGTDTVAFWPDVLPVAGEPERYPTSLADGAAGIGYFLVRLARTVEAAGGDPAPWLEAAKRTASWLEGLMVYEGEGGAAWVPPVVSGDSSDSPVLPGLSDGVAGVAYFFMVLHQATGIDAYAADACALLRWLEAEDVRIDELRGTTWPLSPAGDERGAGTDLEAGAAGIGWTFLQGWRALHEGEFRDMADRAGTWLSNAEVGHYYLGKAFWPARIEPFSAVDVDEDSGWSEGGEVPGTHDTERAITVYPGLLHGVAGIGWFLKENGQEQEDPDYSLEVAGQATTWLYYTGEQAGSTGSLFVWPVSISRLLNTREASSAASAGYHDGMAGIVAWLAEARSQVRGEEAARAVSVLGLERLEAGQDPLCSLSDATSEEP